MAKIKFGMMMTDARGKLGGQVFSKNRSGAYVRTKVTPVNPQTTAQQANRSLLGTLSALWSALTEAQRDAWNSAVEQWQKTNVFGDLSKPTGKNLFTGLNKVLLANFPAADYMVLPPAKAEFAAFQIVSASFAAGLGAKTITLTGFNPTTNFQVRATAPLTAGTSYFKNLLRSMGEAITVSPEGILTVTGGYNATFGAVSSGSKIGIEVRQVGDNGQLSAPVMYTTIVV